MDDVGIFRTTIEVQNLDMRGPRRALPETLVDTGSEYTWVPRRVLEELGIRAQRKQAFEVADGRRIERDIGYALVRAADTARSEVHTSALQSLTNLVCRLLLEKKKKKTPKHDTDKESRSEHLTHLRQ